MKKAVKAARKLNVRLSDFSVRNCKLFFNSNAFTHIELAIYTHTCVYEFAHGRVLNCVSRVG